MSAWKDAKERLRIWATKLKLFAAYELRGKRSPRFVFVHLPKTAGTSTTFYICRRVGWTKTGNSMNFSEMPWRRPHPAGLLDRANKVRYLYGHLSFATVDKLDTGLRPNFMFHFQRDPRARVASHYRHMHTGLTRFVDKNGNPRKDVPTYDLFVKCAPLSAEDFFGADDDELGYLVDNLSVRQMAGDMVTYPISDEQWPMLMERAKENLKRLDFVGFQETYNEDFAELIRRMRLKSGRDTSAAYNRNVHKGDREPLRFPEGSKAAANLERYIKYDQALYDFAKQLYDQGYWSERKGLSARPARR